MTWKMCLLEIPTIIQATYVHVYTAQFIFLGKKPQSLYNCPTHHKNPNHCRSMINISTEQLFKICTGFLKDIFTILMDENVLRTNITETGTLMYERKSTSSKINDESTWYNVQINHTVSFPMTSVPHRMRYQCCKLYLGQVKICAR